MNQQYILALDQGTTSSRAILYNDKGEPVGMAQKEFTQIYPKAGWVEHNPIEIWNSQLSVAQQVLKSADISAKQVAAIGITNQRETTIIWDAESGTPIYNAIVWQDRRTAPFCNTLKEKGLASYIKENTGLVIDAYFSGTKINWILNEVEGARGKAEKGQLRFGTVDSWLIYNLTKGKVHATDYTNASRTMLYNIKTLQWDAELLNHLDVPKELLPVVKDSDGDYGVTDASYFDGVSIPIRGVAGDQQAALFGQNCTQAGMAKNTYGTGCFMLMQTGDEIIQSKNGLITTIASGLNGKIQYALEGSVFIAGAAIQWLRDELKIIDAAADSEYFGSKVPDTGGVYVVPAFAGLGAPYWDMEARGAIYGLTRGTSKAHLVRATLESLAYQTTDVLNAMEADSGIELKALRVDGGAAQNDLLMQFQADILNTKVVRPQNTETTALGAAYLAGNAVGLYNLNQLDQLNKVDSSFTPDMEEADRKALYKGWLNAVERTKS